MAQRMKHSLLPRFLDLAGVDAAALATLAYLRWDAPLVALGTGVLALHLLAGVLLAPPGAFW